MVPIDDSKLGNLAIRDAFGLTDKEKYYLFPQIVMFHPKDGRYAVLEHPPEPAPENRKKDKMGKNVVASRFTINRISQWINALEVLHTEKYSQLDLDQMEQFNDEVYAFIKKATREEVYQLEKEFNEKHPLDAEKPSQIDLQAIEKYRQSLLLEETTHGDF